MALLDDKKYQLTHHLAERHPGKQIYFQFAESLRWFVDIHPLNIIY